MDQVIFNELKIIQSQLTALTYMLAVKEGHKMGIYDDKTYKEIIEDTAYFFCRRHARVQLEFFSVWNWRN